MRYLLVLFGLLFMTDLSAQTTVQPVMLQWKIKPGDTLSYRTMMDKADSVKVGDTMINFESSKIRYMDTASSLIAQGMRNAIKSMSYYEQFSQLTNSGKGVIDIEMYYRDKKDTIGTNSPDFRPYIAGTNTFRGQITEKGKIESFYLKTTQKNILSLFFELPGKPVKPGDTWPLEVQLISLDNTFKCDSSFRKNNVTLIALKKSGKETIAVVRYDIEEFVTGLWKLTSRSEPRKVSSTCRFVGQAEFSIEKGCWIKYEGALLLQGFGLFDQETIQHFVLQPD